MHKTCFIGHRRVFGTTINERLMNEIEQQIKNGCKLFSMGTHGEFDRLALAACRSLREKYKDIEIEVVITSLHTIEKKDSWDYVPYSDVGTVMFDIEDVHYKRQITSSNFQMIDACDNIICYVADKLYTGGAKTAMLYAQKRGKNVINLYRNEDLPFYGMSKEEIRNSWDELCNKFFKINDD